MTDNEAASLRFNCLAKIVERLNDVIGGGGATVTTFDTTRTTTLDAGSNSTTVVCSSYVLPSHFSL